MSRVKEVEVLANPERRERGLARLAELGDHPGGEAFLARMGDMGDWLVDFVFGDVHSRPGLSARERELIILGLLTGLGGCEPQVRAHVQALREIAVTDGEIEEAILQTAPYTGFPRAINALKVLREEQGR
ncbi:MAG TPA: carboxymuconolactone decarboxylase family protein [Thermoleophilia bacterium]|nr:carboxymuconolactone decarboxylase family protein [Thermoleophilia bacterium]